MPIDPETARRVRDMATERGQDPNGAMAEAERIVNDGKPNGSPVAERLLIGYLPVVTVKELRSRWLGLTDEIVDDHLPFAIWMAKHGGAATAPAPESE